MKKMLALLIGLLIFSVVFTGCGTPVETPTNVESNAEQTAGDIVQSEEQQEDAIEENDTVSVASKTVENNDKDVVSKETQTEKEPVETASKVTSKTTALKVIEKESDDNDADIGTDADSLPVFNTVTAMQNWLLSGEDSTQFSENRELALSTMLSGNKIVYYRPTIEPENDLLVLDKVKISGSTVYYCYHFVDKAYDDIELKISCYMDDSFKENYLEALDDLEKQVYGYASAEVNNHQVLYRDNQFGTTNFLWQQFGGYIYASLKGENHADKVQEVLPYLNLEKVTLRTDLETQ